MKQEYEIIIPKEQADIMLERNPYRKYLFFGLLNSDWEKFNNLWQTGFIKGKYYTANRILLYIKEKELNKKDFVSLIEFVTERELKHNTNEHK